MSEHEDRQQRDASGRFGEKATEQDVLEIFDSAADPVLTASEVADQLPITREATVRRLNRMHEAGVVGRKNTGANAVAWWAKFAPAPSAETMRDVEATEGELECGEVTSLADAKARYGLE